MILMLIQPLKNVLEYALMISMVRNQIIFVFLLVRLPQLFFIITILIHHVYKIVQKDILQIQVCRFVHNIAHLHLHIMLTKLITLVLVNVLMDILQIKVQENVFKHAPKQLLNMVILQQINVLIHVQ